MKAALIFLSMSGNTAKMAEEIAAGIREEGGEAHLFNIREEVDYEYVQSCDSVIFGTPAISGGISGELKMWLDQNGRKLGLYGKLGSVFATAKFIHGGADLAMVTLMTEMLCSGMMVFSTGGGIPGTEKGMTMIHTGPVALDKEMEQYAPLFRLYGKRFAARAKAIAG